VSLTKQLSDGATLGRQAQARLIVEAETEPPIQRRAAHGSDGWRAGGLACGRRAELVRIAISQAASDAIASRLPPGSTGYENAVNDEGERLIWLERRMLDKLNSYRRAGESYSDVILRLAGEG
jgi:hypothetical protein